MRRTDRYAGKDVVTTEADSTELLRNSITMSHLRGPVVAAGKKWLSRIDVSEKEEKDGTAGITVLDQKGKRIKFKYTTTRRRRTLGAITRFTRLHRKMRRRIISPVKRRKKWTGWRPKTMMQKLNS